MSLQHEATDARMACKWTSLNPHLRVIQSFDILSIFAKQTQFFTYFIQKLSILRLSKIPEKEVN